MSIQVGDRVRIVRSLRKGLIGATGTYGGQKAITYASPFGSGQTILKEIIFLDKPFQRLSSSGQVLSSVSEIAFKTRSSFELISDVSTQASNGGAEAKLNDDGAQNLDFSEIEKKPVTLGEFLRADHYSKRPSYEGQSNIWKSEGLCPHCGEKGRFSHFAYVCSKHGEY